MKHTGWRNKGFTLIELLVAVSLTAVLIASLYAAFFSVAGAGKRADESLRSYLSTGKMLEKFSSEVHSAYFKGGNPFTVFKGEALRGGSVITFTSLTYPVMSSQNASGDMVKISYFMGEGEEADRLFKEISNPYTEERFRIEAASKIKSFDLSYFNGKDWSRAWDSALEKGVPKAVRALIVLGTGEEFSIVSRTVLK